MADETTEPVTTMKAAKTTAAIESATAAASAAETAELDIDDIDTIVDAREAKPRLKGMTRGELLALLRQQEERDKLRESFAQDILAELNDREKELAREREEIAAQRSALELRYKSQTDASLKVPGRFGSRGGIATWVCVAVLMLGGGYMLRSNITVTTSANAQVLMVSPDFAKDLVDSGTYWSMTADEQDEVDRALKEREGR